MSAAARKTRAPEPIRSLASLRDHLQTALEIEHATLPPYFTAWLSIVHGKNTDAADIVRSVMLEEMLHLTLAANLLNAVGGRPRLTYSGFVATYPTMLPHSGATFEVSVEKFSKSALETFLKIERPEAEGAKPEADQWETIGQFYAAIRDGIDYLHHREKKHGGPKVFTGKRSLQVRPEDYYGSGHVIEVHNKRTAHAAIDEIVEQGEGAHEGIFDHDAAIFPDSEPAGEQPEHEVAHYFRFNEVLQGRRYRKGDTMKSGPRGPKIQVDWNAVHPIRSNVRLADYPAGSEIRGALERFSGLYGGLLASLESVFDGNRTEFTRAIAQMFSLRDEALALMKTPSGDGRTNVGPAFEPPLKGKRPVYRGEAPVRRGGKGR